MVNMLNMTNSVSQSRAEALQQLSKKYLLAVLAATWMLSGCSSESVDSEGIATSAIWAGITITTTNNSQAGITVELNVGGDSGTNLVLNNNDRVDVTSSRETITLTQDTDFLDVDYEGSIDISGGGDTLTVALVRGGSNGSSNSGQNNDSAPNSNLIIPEPFMINFPQDGMTRTMGGQLDPALTDGVIEAKQIRETSDIRLVLE